MSNFESIMSIETLYVEYILHEITLCLRSAFTSSTRANEDYQEVGGSPPTSQAFLRPDWLVKFVDNL